MNRVLSTARVQLAAWPSTLGMPWLVLGGAFLVNLMVFALLDTSGEDAFTGGLTTFYAVMLVAYIITMTHYFPMILGLSVTRRTFYLATCLMALAQSLCYGAALTMLELVESATGGWGVSLPFFGVEFLQQSNVLLQLLAYAVPILLVSFLGMFFGVIFKRWGVTGMYILAITALVVLGGLAVLVSWRRWWGEVGAWFVDQSSLSLLAGWPALLTLVLAAASLLMLRRATP
ncbi:hypothetical protein DFQ14_111119 [Halopolyspora algeriensis]|uniref:Uncharacterized protein n=1 Tax=Halopolyspora algeriensis TaxID=1500506 RepID=A0A368VGQ3_9ACTN|nr:hypothetical protein [Halopolyspora algeriensis]RCW40470.1 hypothetical protein DFQ14_111119 [Halopolyspora algeriensis]TQM53753.1 hypothetical protein FHU43_1917 [Halopolyspora algeriensis]